MASDYRLRIWVKIVAIAELIFVSINLLVALVMPLLIIGAHWSWGFGKQFLEMVKDPDVTLSLAFLQKDFDRGSVTALLLLMVIVILLYLVQTFVSLSLVRGCSKELDPTVAFELVRVWRNWTLVLTAVHTLDYVQKEGLASLYYLIPVGIIVFKFVLVLFFLHEIKERMRAEGKRGGSGEKNSCDTKV